MSSFGPHDTRTKHRVAVTVNFVERSTETVVLQSVPYAFVVDVEIVILMRLLMRLR